MKARKELTSPVFWKNVGLHLLVWALIFLLNYFLVKNYPVAFKTWFHVKVWIIYIFIFYINYLFLMPFLLFRKKAVIYAFSVLLLLLASTLIRTRVQEKYFVENFQDRFIQRRNILREKMPPLPDEGRRDFFNGKGLPPRRPFGPFGKDFYGLLLIYAISTSIKLSEKWQDSEKKRNETEKQKLFAELSYLKKQVNPHFLFNALNNIYSLSISRSDQTTNAILKLSSILRYMLYETNSIRPLKNEVEIIHNYIGLQKFRITNNVSITFEVDGDTQNYMIEPLLLLPLIENAFKFGVDNVNDSFIEIFLKIKEDDRLEFRVINKIVNKPVRNNEDFGIGIKNIQRRLELLYPGNHEFISEEKEQVFSVNLNIKLKR